MLDTTVAVIIDFSTALRADLRAFATPAIARLSVVSSGATRASLTASWGHPLRDPNAARSRARRVGCTTRALLTVLAICVLVPAVTRAQSLAWNQRGGTGPGGRYSHAMAYDSARGVTVLFGGNLVSNQSGETWEWSGSGGGAWTPRLVAGPSPRFGHAMVYDVARGVTVLFGGAANVGGNNAETWEWNGTAWTQRFVVGPSARRFHGMCYDSARGVTVLFGGFTSVRNGETWEWNGTTWSQRVVSGPTPRIGQGMAFDAARGVSVLFSGGTAFAVYSADTWEWNGTAWSLRASSGPSPRGYYGLVYEPAAGTTVLFGGWNDSNRNAETWDWNGTVWTQHLINGPAPRYSTAMAYDSARRVAVLFGGHTGSAANDTWEQGVGCGGPSIVNYCTAGTSASGCQAALSACGLASASASSGFNLIASAVEGNQNGLFYFGTSGRQAIPWGNGTSFRCVVPPTVRAPLLIGTGTSLTCDGSFSQDLNSFWCPTCSSPAANPGLGAVVQAQLWYRDPLSTSNQTSSFSDGIEFTMAP